MKDYLKNVTKDMVKVCFNRCISGVVVDVQEEQVDGFGKAYRIEYTTPANINDYEYSQEEGNLPTAVSCVGEFGLIVGLHEDKNSYGGCVTPFDYKWAKMVIQTLETEDEVRSFIIDYSKSRRDVIRKEADVKIKKINESVMESEAVVGLFERDLMGVTEDDKDLSGLLED